MSANENQSCTIQLEMGERRVNNQSSARLFFVYVTPTGAEVSLSKCPSLRRVWGQTTGGFDGGSRTQTVEYEVRSATRIKMVNLVSVLGRARRIVNLFVDVDPNAAVIKFHGLDEFGGFTGRGKPDYRASSFSEHKSQYNFDDAMMKGTFGLHVLQPPRGIVGKKAVRSLIF